MVRRVWESFVEYSDILRLLAISRVWQVDYTGKLVLDYTGKLVLDYTGRLVLDYAGGLRQLVLGLFWWTLVSLLLRQEIHSL